MITASIVIYKTSKPDLDRVVASAIPDGVDRLYMVDHSPVDYPAPELPDSDKIVYLRRPNLGYGTGHNHAIRLAMEEGSDFHAVLNPDIYWEGGVIGRLAAYMETHDDVGMMVPKVLYPNGDLQYVCKLIPTPYDLIANRFLPKRLVRKRIARFRLEASGYDRIMNVPYMHGCFFMLRIGALKDVGLFDERFFMYPEDIDLTRRIHEKWRTLYYPEVCIFHAHAAESRKSWKMLRIHAATMVKYFNKWGWFYDKKRRLYNRRVLSEVSGGRS